MKKVNPPELPAGKEVAVIFSEIINKIARRKMDRSMRFRTGGSVDISPTGSEPKLLYLHIPFCERLCPYCSFNRVQFREELGKPYWRALQQEIGLYKKAGCDFTAVYVGGGTPTIQIEELEDTLGLLKQTFSIRQISVETNPNHLQPRYIDILKRSGVNRLSVGIQSFDAGLLQAMERYDKYGSGPEIVGRLKSVLGEFETLNADMIFNFPTQTGENLERDLDILIESGVDQITYYPLMVSDSTRETVARNLGKVDYSREAAFYRQIVDKLRTLYDFSSVWCFSRRSAARDKKSQSRIIDEYIISYDEYAGLGSGSVGYLNGTCYANTFNIETYIAQVNRGDLPIMATRSFDPGERAFYDFLMQLFGMKIDFDMLRKKYGDAVFRNLWYPLAGMRLIGGIGNSFGKYYVTDRGRYYALIMMREFFIAVNNFRDFCRSERTETLSQAQNR